MKILIALIASLTLIACGGLSEKEKKGLEFRLSLRNINATTNYQVARINERARLEIKYIGYSKADTAKAIPLELQIFDRQWNSPYDIKRDTAITLDKYLDYCEKHNKNPKYFIDELNEYIDQQTREMRR
jgi:hypothetical protein